MLMDSTNCEHGDRISLSSYLLEEKELFTLEFAYYMNLKKGDNIAALTVAAFYTLGGLLKETFLHISGSEDPEVEVINGAIRMQTIHKDNKGWKYVAIALPVGSYYIGFEATCGLPYVSNIAIDDIVWFKAKKDDLLIDGQTKLGSLSAGNVTVQLDIKESNYLLLYLFVKLQF